MHEVKTTINPKDVLSQLITITERLHLLAAERICITEEFMLKDALAEATTLLHTMDSLMRDAALYGAGFAAFYNNGLIERLDPTLVRVSLAAREQFE